MKTLGTLFIGATIGAVGITYIYLDLLKMSHTCPVCKTKMETISETESEEGND